MEDPQTRKNWAFVRSNLKELVLDAGCGDGLVTHVHPATIGMDLLHYADCIIPRARFVRGDFHSIPFKSHTFDVVVLHHSLEHSPHPSLVLRESYRVLKQNGKVLVISPNAGNFLWPLYLLLHKYLYYKDHASFFTYDSLRRLMEGMNFEKIKTFSSLLLPRIPTIWVQRIFQEKLIAKIANLLTEKYPERFSCDVMIIGYKHN